MNQITTLSTGHGDVIVHLGSLSSGAQTLGLSSPRFSSITPVNGPTSGSTTVTITGSSFTFSQVAAAGTVKVGSEDASITAWNHTSITIQTPANIGAHSVKLYVLGVKGEANNNVLDDTFTYDSPEIVSVTPNTNLSPTGTTVITLTGTSFGFTGTVSVNFKNCPLHDKDNTYSHTSLECTAPAQSGTNLKVQLKVGTKFSNRDKTVDYESAGISGIMPLNGPTSGGYVLTVAGSGFGVPGDRSVYVDDNLCPAVSGSYSDTVIECTAPEGSGANVSVVVKGFENGDIPVESAPALFTYDAPVLDAVNDQRQGTEGGYELTLTGSNFGPALDGKINVYHPGDLTNTECVVASANDYTHDVIKCTIGEMLSSFTVEMTVNVSQRVSNVANYSYQAFDVQTFSPTNGPTDGSTSVCSV